MNTKITIAFFLLISSFLNAQDLTKKVEIDNLPIIFMGKDVNIHIISPEPIQFVDLSTNNLIGDLPSDNIARIKIEHESPEELEVNKYTKKLTKAEKYTTGMDVGIITIVGQSFLTQYRVIYQNDNKNWLTSSIHIQPEQMQPLEYPILKYSNFELKKFALEIQKKNTKKSIRKAKNLKTIMKLNNVYIIENYIFLDITIENKTNLSFDIEGFKFSIEDKKIYKATNNQSIYLNPLFSLNDQKKIRKSYRNIFVFEKFTFPNSKILKIRLIEEQISGRMIDMKINYSDILQADTF